MDILTADGRTEKAAALTGALFVGLFGIAAASQINLIATGETAGMNMSGSVILLTSAPTSHPTIVQQSSQQADVGQTGTSDASHQPSAKMAPQNTGEPLPLQVPPVQVAPSPEPDRPRPTVKPIAPVLPETAAGTLPVPSPNTPHPKPPLRPAEPVHRSAETSPAMNAEPVSKLPEQTVQVSAPKMHEEKREDLDGGKGSQATAAASKTDTVTGTNQASAAAAAAHQAPSGLSPQAQGDYWAIVNQKLNAAKRYPRAARKRGITGTAILRFTVEATGAISTYAITESSGSRILDRAVLAMIRDVGALPPFPDSFQETRITKLVPVAFLVE